MANRHLFRSLVLQVLFELDMRDFKVNNFKDIVEYDTKSFLLSSGDDNTKIVELIKNIVEKKNILDEVIEKAAPAWSIHKITIVDRNILRLGIYELLFIERNLVPAKVAINESIELAKQYGGLKSGRFINGVIGAVYRELGEPGKDDSSKKKYANIPLEEMEIDQKGAAVVYSIDKNGVVRIGMVHDIFGYWTLSKGGIEEDESKEAGTIREVKEETNWDVEIITKLGENEYIAYHPKRGPVRKQVQYFLARSEYTKPKLEIDSGGLDDVRWFELSEISDLNMYDDVSKMLIKAIEIITEKHLENEDDQNTNTLNLSDMKLNDLKILAKERGLSGYSSLKKDELIDLLSK